MINYIKYINIHKIHKVHVDVKSKTKIIICSDTQKEKAEHEWEAVQMPSSSLPTQTNPVQFSTPQSKHFMGSAASTPTLDRDPLMPMSSTGCSPLLSTSSSTLTPNLDKLKLGHGRGRPHKELTPVDYSDFPSNTLKKEQEKWQKRKTWKSGDTQRKWVLIVMSLGRQKVKGLWNTTIKRKPKNHREVRAMQVMRWLMSLKLLRQMS